MNEAQSAATKAMKLSQQAGSQTPRYEAALASARVNARLGKIADARREMSSVLSSAEQCGYRLYTLQARLALAEVAMKSNGVRVPRT